MSQRFASHALKIIEIYGNFITKDNPSIPNLIANGASSNIEAYNPVSAWPAWNDTKPMLINLNQTGGTAYTATLSIGIPVTQYRQPGLHNNFTVADARAWEGGRGERCDFWKKMSPYIPQ
jgi:hypothetical protein